MKKSLLLITMLLLSAAWVVAQSTSPAPSTSQPGAAAQSSPSGMGSQTSPADQGSAKASAKSENSIRGCLGGSAGNYTLTDSATGKTYKLTGSDSDLSAHIGQEVELNGSSASASAGMTGSAASNPSGSAASSGAAGSAATTPGASSTGAVEASNFNVKSVTKIADTCSNK